MRHALLALVTVACEGQPAIDTPDATTVNQLPPDPFAGMFDEPSDLPRANCTSGSVAGFALSGYWPELAMRTEMFGGLHVYMMTPADDATGAEALAEHALDSDDLFARATMWDGAAWRLRAIAICGVDADGTLHGAEVACTGVDACAQRPVTARRLDRIAGETEGDHLVKLGEYRGDWGAGSTVAVRTYRDVAFVAHADGLHFVSVHVPDDAYELAAPYYGVAELADLELVRGVDGRRYALAIGAPISHVLDVDDPSQPRHVAVMAGARAAFVDGTTGYFVDGESAEVQVYDLSAPQQPRRIATFAPASSIHWHDVFAANGIAYLADATGSGIHAIDFRDPANPRELAVESDGDVTLVPWLTTVGDAAVVLAAGTHELRVLDGALAPVGSWSLRDLVALRDVRAIGNRAYVAHHRDGIRVIGLDTPSAPTQVGYFNTWLTNTGSARAREGAFALDVDRARSRIYVADSIRGLVILQGDATIFP